MPRLRLPKKISSAWDDLTDAAGDFARSGKDVVAQATDYLTHPPAPIGQDWGDTGTAVVSRSQAALDAARSSMVGQAAGRGGERFLEQQGWLWQHFGPGQVFARAAGLDTATDRLRTQLEPTYPGLAQAITAGRNVAGAAALDPRARAAYQAQYDKPLDVLQPLRDVTDIGHLTVLDPAILGARKWAGTAAPGERPFQGLITEGEHRGELAQTMKAEAELARRGGRAEWLGNLALRVGESVTDPWMYTPAKLPLIGGMAGPGVNIGQTMLRAAALGAGQEIGTTGLGAAGERIGGPWGRMAGETVGGLVGAVGGLSGLERTAPRLSGATAEKLAESAIKARANRAPLTPMQRTGVPFSEAVAGGTGRLPAGAPAIVPVDVARRQPGAVRVEAPDDEFARWVQHYGGRVDADGVMLPIYRFQAPDARSEYDPLRGIFYNAGVPDEVTGLYVDRLNVPGQPGGSHAVAGTTLFRRPLIARLGFDDEGLSMPTESALLQLTPGATPKQIALTSNRIQTASGNLYTAAEELDNAHRWMGVPPSAADTKHLAEAEQAYNRAHSAWQVESKRLLADAGVTDPGGVLTTIESVFPDPFERAWGVIDRAAVERARAAGYDSILGYHKDRGIVEIIDLREAQFPGLAGEFTLRPEFRQPQVDAEGWTRGEPLPPGYRVPGGAMGIMPGEARATPADVLRQEQAVGARHAGGAYSPQSVMAAYRDLTPGRVARLRDDVTGRIAEQYGIDQGLLKQTWDAGVRQFGDTGVVVSNIGPGAADAIARTGKLTSKFEWKNNLDEVGEVSQGQVGDTRLGDLAAGRDFALREARAHDAAFGSHNMPDDQGARDADAFPVTYAHVTAGPPLIAEGAGSISFIWKPDTDLVATPHHHWGLLSPFAKLHEKLGNTPLGRLVWGDDVLRGATLDRNAPGGALRTVTDGIDVGGGRRIASTDLLVGPEGVPAVRMAALMSMMPEQVRDAVTSGRITDPEQLASVLLREGGRQDQPAAREAKSLLKKAGQTLTKEQSKAILEEFKLGSARNDRRTEALLVNPTTKNIGAIYLVGTHDDIYQPMKGKLAYKLNGKWASRWEMAQHVKARIDADNPGTDIPILWKNVTPEVTETGGVRPRSKLISDVEVLAGTEVPLAPGRAGVVERYKAAGFPDIGAVPTRQMGDIPRWGEVPTPPAPRALSRAMLRGDVFNAVIGGGIGATQGDTREERMRNALIGAGIMVGGNRALGYVPAARHLAAWGKEFNEATLGTVGNRPDTVGLPLPKRTREILRERGIGRYAAAVGDDARAREGQAVQEHIARTIHDDRSMDELADAVVTPNPEADNRVKAGLEKLRETTWRTPTEGVFKGVAPADSDRLSAQEIWDRAQDVQNQRRVKILPDWVKGPEDIQRMSDYLLRLAKEGAPGRYWYERSSAAVLRMMHGDTKAAEEFVKLLAIYSPQNKVANNAVNAMRVWHQNATGVQIRGGQKATADEWARALMHRGESWEGTKTNNFYRNLMLLIDPEVAGRADAEAKTLGVTVDVWIMRALGYDAAGAAPRDVAPGHHLQYDFVANMLKRTAAQLNREGGDWEPHQIQAALWVAVNPYFNRALGQEAAEVAARTGKDVEAVLKLGGDNGGIKPSQLIERMMREQPDQEIADDIADTSKDFADAIAANQGQVRQTTGPHPDSPIGQRIGGGYATADTAMRQAYHNDLRAALHTDDGVDILAQEYGLPRGVSRITRMEGDHPTTYVDVVVAPSRQQLSTETAPLRQRMGMRWTGEGEHRRLTPVEPELAAGREARFIERTREKGVKYPAGESRPYTVKPPGKGQKNEKVEINVPRADWRAEPAAARQVESYAASYGLLTGAPEVEWGGRRVETTQRDANTARLVLRDIRPDGSMGAPRKATDAELQAISYAMAEKYGPKQPKERLPRAKKGEPPPEPLGPMELNPPAAAPVKVRPTHDGLEINNLAEGTSQPFQKFLKEVTAEALDANVDVGVLTYRSFGRTIPAHRPGLPGGRAWQNPEEAGQYGANFLRTIRERGGSAAHGRILDRTADRVESVVRKYEDLGWGPPEAGAQAAPGAAPTPRPVGAPGPFPGGGALGFAPTPPHGGAPPGGTLPPGGTGPAGGATPPPGGAAPPAGAGGAPPPGTPRPSHTLLRPAVGAIVGGAAGATQGDTVEERLKNAAIGAGIGVAGTTLAPDLARYAARQGSIGKAAATIGHDVLGAMREARLGFSPDHAFRVAGILSFENIGAGGLRGIARSMDGFTRALWINTLGNFGAYKQGPKWQAMEASRARRNLSPVAGSAAATTLGHEGTLARLSKQGGIYSILKLPVGIENWAFERFVPTLMAETADDVARGIGTRGKLGKLAPEAKYDTILKRIEDIATGVPGKPQGQRNFFENLANLVILSPNWTRGQLRNVGQIFSNSPEGELARRFWTATALMGVSMAAGISVAFGGKDPRDILNPNHPDSIINPRKPGQFMTAWLPGGRKISVLGPYGSLMRALVAPPAEAVAQGWDAYHEQMVSGAALHDAALAGIMAGLGGGIEAAGYGVKDWGHGRLSVPASLFDQLFVTNEDPGTKRPILTETEAGPKFLQGARQVAKQAVPIAFNPFTLFSGENPTQRGTGPTLADQTAAFVAENLTGQRYTPAPHYPDGVKEQAAQFLTSKGIYPTADPVARFASGEGISQTDATAWRNTHKELDTWMRDVREKRVESRPGLPVGRDQGTQFTTRMQSAKKTEEGAIAAAGADFRAGKISGSEYRDRVGAAFDTYNSVRRHEATASLGMDDAAAADTNAIYDRLDSILGKRTPTVTPTDKLLEAYQDIHPAPGDTSRAGQEAASDARAQFLAKLSPEQRRDLETAQDERAQALDPSGTYGDYVKVQRLHREYAQISPYLMIPDPGQARAVSQVLDRAQQRLAYGIVPPGQMRLAILLDPQADALTKSYALLVDRQKARASNPLRSLYRQQHPELAKYYSDLMAGETVGGLLGLAS